VTKIQMLLSAGILALSSIVLCGCQTGVGIDIGLIFCNSCHHYHRPYESCPIVIPPQPPVIVPPHHHCPPNPHNCPHHNHRRHYKSLPREFRCIKGPESVAALCEKCHIVHILTMPCPEVRWIYPDSNTRPVLIPAPRYEDQHAVTYGHTHCR